MTVQLSFDQNTRLRAWWLADARNPQGGAPTEHLAEAEKLVTELGLRDISHLRAIATGVVSLVLERL